MPSDPQDLQYSAEELSAYYYELEWLLVRVESSETHYQTLGVDYLATSGEIATEYSRAMILFDLEICGLDLPLPEELEPRVKKASDRVSDAFGTLMDFDKRLEYDGRLFGWGDDNSKHQEPRQQSGKSKSKGSSKEQKNANRRVRERFELPIPVEVTGYDESGNDWHEAVQSVDISRAGASILMRRRLLVGNTLYLRMPMPTVLRAHDYLYQTYGTYAIVRWVKPPRDGLRMVGVEFVGQLPPPGFLERPWAAFQPKWEGADRRIEARENLSEAVEIEYFDESEQLIKKDAGLIENISASGVRVCAQQPPQCADLIRIIRPKVSSSVFALVRNRFKSRDGYERLCAQFIKGSSVDDRNN